MLAGYAHTLPFRFGRRLGHGDRAEDARRLWHLKYLFLVTYFFAQDVWCSFAGEAANHFLVPGNMGFF